MNESFDEDLFLRRHGRIMAVPFEVPLDQRLVEIGKLRKDFAELEDKACQTFVDRSIENLILRAFIDTGQSFEKVNAQFQHYCDSGFHSFWRDVFDTMCFAEYCRDQGRKSEGLCAINNSKERLWELANGLPLPDKEYLDSWLEKCIKYLNENDDSNH